ncbi:TonB-dependent receptor [Novosphingobium sp. BL-8A]|uniref:TonB-dependent receptor n=1 Tax=Novosphingobium sp. BL-8A TaxID=3127639 RepID=UPI0037579802
MPSRKGAPGLAATTWLAAALTFAPGVAFAQDDAAPAPEDTAQPKAGEIIVTARKRQESILRVPVVESVLSGEVLQQQQINSIQAVTSRVPGLILGNSVLAVGSQISLRGVGTSALDAGIDQSVSLNIDGQQFSQGLSFRSGLFDLAQAEVLKGPQALFFGKNSPGGVIALTTADPGRRFELIARTSYEFEAREMRGELIASGPVTDTLGLRLAGTWSDSDGWFRNKAVAYPGTGAVDPRQPRTGGNENYIIRGTAVWEPASSFKARLKLNFTKDHSDNPATTQSVSCPDGIAPVVSPTTIGYPFLVSCKQGRDVYFVSMDPAAFTGLRRDGTPGLRNNGEPFTNIVQNFGVLDMTWRPATDLSLTSTTTYYHNTTDAAINGTGTGAAGPALFADNHFKRRDVTEELRLESDWRDSPVNFLLGGYYQNGKVTNDIFVGGNTSQLLYVGAYGIFIPIPAVLSAGTHDMRIESTSLFGQVRWNPVKTLELALGARWTSEQRRDDAVSRNALGEYVEIDLPTPKISSKNVSPELTVTWTPGDDFTVFGALKQGYKSGSYSITTPAVAGIDNSFGDERVRGGELGVKARTADRSLTANAAFYYYRYKGLQVGTNVPAQNGIPVVRTMNAGSSKVYGVDFDAAWHPPQVEDLSLTAAVNWNKARFLSLEGVPCYGGQTYAAGCNQLLDPSTGLYTAQSASGEPLERAPEWQLSAGADYELPVSRTTRFALGSSVQYSASYHATIGPREDYIQGSYAKLNAYLTLKGADDRWEVSLIANNLTNVIRAGYCTNGNFQNGQILGGQVTGSPTNAAGPAGIDEVSCVLDPGRQVFLKLTLRPFG